MNTIAIGPHLFTPDALAKALSVVNALPPDPKHPGAFVGTLDSTGTKVALQMTLAGTWQIETAFVHTWDGDNQFGAQVIGRF